MAWGSWKLGLWGVLEAVGLGGTWEFGIPSLNMGAPNFGFPQKGKSSLKIENFLEIWPAEGCGPYWVGFIQGTGGFLRVQWIGTLGGPVLVLPGLFWYL